jgi:hypothetical protein
MGGSATSASPSNNPPTGRSSPRCPNRSSRPPWPTRRRSPPPQASSEPQSHRPCARTTDRLPKATRTEPHPATSPAAVSGQHQSVPKHFEQGPPKIDRPPDDTNACREAGGEDRETDQLGERHGCPASRPLPPVGHRSFRGTACQHRADRRNLALASSHDVPRTGTEHLARRGSACSTRLSAIHASSSRDCWSSPTVAAGDKCTHAENELPYTRMQAENEAFPAPFAVLLERATPRVSPVYRPCNGVQRHACSPCSA